MVSPDGRHLYFARNDVRSFEPSLDIAWKDIFYVPVAQIEALRPPRLTGFLMGPTPGDPTGKPAYARRFAAVEPFYNGQARVECFDGVLNTIDESGVLSSSFAPRGARPHRERPQLPDLANR